MRAESGWRAPEAFGVDKAFGEHQWSAGQAAPHAIGSGAARLAGVWGLNSPCVEAATGVGLARRNGIFAAICCMLPDQSGGAGFARETCRSGCARRVADVDAAGGRLRGAA